MLYKDFPIHIVKQKKTKLVCGIGINDAYYQVSVKLDDVVLKCPIYTRWITMLQRCYDEKVHQKYPPYVGCTVDERWHSFMAFREWVLAQPEWEGLQLDKDILILGNKIYGPDTCIFVSRDINTFITNINKGVSGLPIGVRAKNGRYFANIGKNENGKRIWTSHLVDTPDEAFDLYVAKKLEMAHELVNSRNDDKLKASFVDYVKYKLGV